MIKNFAGIFLAVPFSRLSLLASFLLAVLLEGCSGTKKENEYYVPKPDEFIVQPPPKSTLDEDIALMLRNNQRVQAMRVCNDVLFSSKSEKDRESAEFWRALLIALEEMENGNLENAIGSLSMDSLGVKNEVKLYTAELLKNILAKLGDHNKESEEGQTALQKIEAENQQLKVELGAAKKRVQELEKLLQKLESVN